MQIINRQNHFKDKSLLCCDCGEAFTFTAGEQEYFLAKSLSVPKRCHFCRDRRKRTLLPDQGVRHDQA